MRVGRFNPQPFDKAASKEVSAELTGTDRATVLGKLRLLPDAEQLKALRSYGFDTEADELEYRLAQSHLAELSDSGPAVAQEPIQEEPEPALVLSPVEAQKKERKPRKSNKKK